MELHLKVNLFALLPHGVASETLNGVTSALVQLTNNLITLLIPLNPTPGLNGMRFLVRIPVEPILGEQMAQSNM